MRTKIIILVSIQLLVISVFAQIPKGINYQGVARNINGSLLTNQKIGIEISIYDSSLNRKDEYIERQENTTNAYGLFSAVIGMGNAVFGNFDSITWQTGQKWVEIKIDPNGKNNYTLKGSHQLLSVPYAFYAENTKTSKPFQKIRIQNDTIYLNENGGSVWIGKYLDNTDSQNLVKIGKTLQITNGNSVVLNDDDSTNEIQQLSISNDTISLNENGGSVWIGKYLDNTDSQNLVKIGKTLQITNGNSVVLNDDDSTNEIQQLSISNDTLRLSKSAVAVKLPVNNPLDDIENALGCVFVHRYCTGDGSFTNPWKSKDSSAGIFEAIKHLTPTKRIVYFKSGFYFTEGALDIDFEKLLPNLSNSNWRIAFSGFGIEFQGHGASIYANGGAPLTGGKPGVLFNWKGQHAFYWKFTGLQFYGVVDTALVQFGNSYDFPWNGCEFDITGNNGYVSSNYQTKPSPSSAIKICWPLESKLHLVGVSATGSGVVLETATFCTISGAFSNTIIPGTNTLYNNSFGLNLINCQSNTFTHMDLEIAYNGIKFDLWSIQNTFSAIFVSNCDSTGATFDNSTQVTNGKNVVISMRSGPTVQAPNSTTVQKLYSTNSDSTKIKVENYFDF